MNVENNADYEKQACLAELQRMSPEELLVLAKLIAGDRVLPETCVHEASHAVVASLLNVPALAWELDVVDITTDHAASP